MAEESKADAEAVAHTTPDVMVSQQQRKAVLLARLQAPKAEGLTLQAIASQLNAGGRRPSPAADIGRRGPWAICCRSSRFMRMRMLS